MDDQAALFEYALRLGDNALVLSHRVSEWVGRAPAIEEELAMGNVALDLIGHSRMWLTLAGDIEGRGRDEDKLAYHRDVGDFRNILLVEQPNGDFAKTLVRQFCFDTWHLLLLRGLANSTDDRIAQIAAKSEKEVAYHVRRSGDWVTVLGDGTEESHRRVQMAVDDLWMYTGEMFEADAVDIQLIRSGAAVDPVSLQAPWLSHVSDVLTEATVDVPTQGWAIKGGKRGVHSEHLGPMLAQMQFLQRAYPNSIW
jgi:ring-1,2-phenylacetyl-CoA epoxidase subunit PaaC